MAPRAVVTELTGYADRVSVHPGEQLSVYASGDGPGEMQIVRLHATVGEGRARFEARPAPTTSAVVVEFTPQRTRHGSYATLPAPWGDPLLEGVPVALEFWVLPSWTPGREGPGGTVASWSWLGMQLSVVHAREGYQLRHHSATGQVALSTVQPARAEPSDWHRIRVSLVDLGRAPRVSLTVDRGTPVVAGLPIPLAEADRREGAGSRDLIVIGAETAEGPGAFDGRVAGVRCLAEGPDGEALLAAWDFGVGERNDTVRDHSPRAAHGRLHQLPVRGVPGPRWRGAEVDPRLAPDEFDAAHFHTDDLADAGWRRTARLQVPSGLESGVYAVELRSGEHRDWVPFAVRAPRSDRSLSESDSPSVAFLLSTFTYQAYANASLGDRIDYQASGISGREYKPAHRDEQIAEHGVVAGSLYDIHADGSGRRYSSLLRPVFNFRPDFTSAVQHAPRHLGADLFILEWLSHQEHDVVVLTDHDLHREGYEALRGARTVVTSSHPEYVSAAMLDALTAHQRSGGSLMYLGGNGFYWVTATADEHGTVIECCRGNAGTRTWDSRPGETHLVSTGEPGGLWRHRGRAPNALVGIGMASQGSDEKAQAFRATPGLLTSRPELAFLFEGMSDPERFGEHGLVMDGASGDELDRWDPELGSPLEAVIVATSERHSKHYMLVHEDVLMSEIRLGADVNDKVRSDIVWWPTGAGGFVFSVGSITWAGAMGYRSFENDCARLSTNALSHMMNS